MAESNGPIVRMPLRVRYHECDQQGIVFHAHYLAYADMASFEVFKALFGSHAELLERGVDVVVAESTVRYLAPCRFDEDLSVEPHVERLGTTSLALRYEILRDDTLAAEVTNRYVWVDPEALRPTAPPDDVRDAFRVFT